MPDSVPRNWPSARHFTEAIQCPSICFSQPLLKRTLPAVDRLGMPLVTSGQFAYVYKLNSMNGYSDLAVRCFRGYLKDREERYNAIQRHVRNPGLPFLSGLTYEQEGILVEGKRFPILFMNWIEGPTLDNYLDHMVGRKDVLLHLASEWVKLIAALRAAGIAHGDLQHGNIIVERGRLRLVDHDGMFTPEMAGWNSSELGHQHYQHPRRDEEFFNARLDNFSALVIYLSLISLAEQPGLWSEHHDENLLFTKADFIDPGGSTLFGKVRELGGEQLRLADVLEQATRHDPNAVPFLAELVSAKSSLPSWMTAPPGMEPQTKTREVLEADLPASSRSPRWKPWKARKPTSRVPAATPSSSYQTIFSGPATGGPPSMGSGPAPAIQPTSTGLGWSSSPSVTNASGPMVPTLPARDPADWLMNTGYFAKEFLRRTFIWWYWGIYICLKILGLDFFLSILLAVLCLVIGSLAYGFVRALDYAGTSQNPQLGISNQTTTLTYTTKPKLPRPRPLGLDLPAPDPDANGNGQPRNSSGTTLTVAPPPNAASSHYAPASITAHEHIIGNSKLNIYHKDDCTWIDHIAQRDRIGFTSPATARAQGYKPCRVCMSPWG
ncbi:MAG TPA: hypothetical protein VGN86_01475 [Pyrinomonadaceae bacterium]|nr:hypothetical protein [Pyrinomonadaceae bacterium]